MSESLYEFQNLYMTTPTESPAQAAVRELAEHCVDLIDEFEDRRCPYNPHGTGGIPITEMERADCRRYAEDVKEELHWFALLLSGISERDWQQGVLAAIRRKDRGMKR